MTWEKLTEWKLKKVGHHVRSSWRSGVNLLCVQLASFLEGGPLMWRLSLHLNSNQKSDYDMMMIKYLCTIMGKVLNFVKHAMFLFVLSKGLQPFYHDILRFCKKQLEPHKT